MLRQNWRSDSLVDPMTNVDYWPEAALPVLQSARAAVRVRDDARGLARFGYLCGKRLFDIAFALAFLIVALPAIVMIVVVQQIDSPGTVLFTQRRIGKGGKPFRCIKLRTMHMDADRMLGQILASCPRAKAEWDRDHKLRDDPRISRFGRVMRALSLDELPQLINILRGEMSVVGPRPIVSAEIPKYGAFYADYVAVKPGLTGLWQVSGRNDVSYEQRVQLDVTYRRRASLAFDCWIVLRTVPAVLAARGCY